MNGLIFHIFYPNNVFAKCVDTVTNMILISYINIQVWNAYVFMLTCFGTWCFRVNVPTKGYEIVESLIHVTCVQGIGFICMVLSGFWFQQNKYKDIALLLSKMIIGEWNPDQKYLDRVPSPKTCKFGPYQIDPKYRKEIYKRFPFYTIEEIVGSYLGHNPYFQSQHDWLNSESESDDADWLWKSLPKSSIYS